ncbi:membrane protein [soil metagenome]
MEGDAGARQLNPDDPTKDDEAQLSRAEESDAEQVDTVTPVTAAEPPRSRLNSRGWVVGVCAALVVAGAALATGGYFALRSDRDATSVAGAESQAMQAAKDCVAATQAPDTNAMAESQAKIIDCATGDYSVQATLYSGVLVEAYQAANAQVEVTDMRAAVERHNDDGSMDVLVALRVKLSNTEVQQQETGYRLRVQMAPDNGTYKIARLDQVTT